MGLHAYTRISVCTVHYRNTTLLIYRESLSRFIIIIAVILGTTTTSQRETFLKQKHLVSDPSLIRA